MISIRTETGFAGAFALVARKGRTWHQGHFMSKMLAVCATCARGCRSRIAAKLVLAYCHRPLRPSWFSARSLRATGRRHRFIQQGSKLVGSGAIGTSVRQGGRSRCPATARTAIVSSPYDNNFVGAAGWVFTQSGGPGPSRRSWWHRLTRDHPSRHSRSRCRRRQYRNRGRPERQQ